MPADEIEAELKDGSTRSKVKAWASLWWDFRTVVQVLHDRTEMPSAAYSEIFARRAVLDAAIIAYGRAFSGGARRDVVDALPLVEDVGAAAVKIHDEAMRWRNQHVAHRANKTWEHIDARLLWATSTAAPTIRVRVSHTLGPDDAFAERLKDHAAALADRIWERRLIPVKDAYFQKLDPRRLTLIKKSARPYTPPATTDGVVMIAVDI